MECTKCSFQFDWLLRKQTDTYFAEAQSKMKRMMQYLWHGYIVYWSNFWRYTQANIFAIAILQRSAMCAAVCIWAVNSIGVKNRERASQTCAKCKWILKQLYVHQFAHAVNSFYNVHFRLGPTIISNKFLFLSVHREYSFVFVHIESSQIHSEYAMTLPFLSSPPLFFHSPFTLLWISPSSIEN